MNIEKFFRGISDRHQSTNPGWTQEQIKEHNENLKTKMEEEREEVAKYGPYALVAIVVLSFACMMLA